MKTLSRSILILLFASHLLTFTACQKDDDKKAPELPPSNSMIMDFGFTATQKSEPVEQRQIINHYAIAALQVNYWSTVAALHTAIPAAAFEKAFENNPVWDDALRVWVWSYSTQVANDVYQSRLTGKIEADSLKWEMYLSKVGNASMQNHLWFEGKSHSRQTGGWWMLNHPKIEGTVQMQPAIKINWAKTSEKVFSLRYTLVAEKVFNPTGNYYETNRAKGSFIEYGKVEDTLFDAYYILNSTESNERFNILWNTSTRAGKVEKAGTTESWCWNQNLVNSVCD